MENGMYKHAYLVMAHNNFGVLKKQLELLDDERNDFFIHIDQRAKDFNEAWLLQNIKYSKVQFIKREKVFWADYSQTQVEINLIREAINNRGEYAYLHLLSGADLPIKSKEYIFNFFLNDNRIYLCCMSSKDSYQKIRTRYYFPFINTNYYRKSKLVKGCSLALGILQSLIGINRHKKKGNYGICYCGWNWFSIPQDFAEYILQNESKIYSTFHHTLASDESFMQTVAMNSIFKERIYKLDSREEGAMRRIDWQRGGPYTFRTEDYDYIMSSPYLYARKFEETIDSDIIDRIYQEVKNQNEIGKRELVR